MPIHRTELVAGAWVNYSQHLGCGQAGTMKKYRTLNNSIIICSVAAASTSSILDPNFSAIEQTWRMPPVPQGCQSMSCKQSWSLEAHLTAKYKMFIWECHLCLMDNPNIVCWGVRNPPKAHLEVIHQLPTRTQFTPNTLFLLPCEVLDIFPHLCSLLLEWGNIFIQAKVTYCWKESK